MISMSNLFGNIKTDRALEVTKQRLMNDNTLKDRTDMSVEQIMDLLEFCLNNTYFVFHGKYYKQKGSPAGYWLYCPDFDSHLFCY